ncbi:MAG TPA: M20/M25/M40 family metallo-hydrolase [Thermoanaerobaculia bacterium]|nr:M20/M25/M40 family metallo-hydrolase [Thermoanaerobaculia bacterium]
MTSIRTHPLSILVALIVAVLGSRPASAEEAVDWEMVGRIRNEGFSSSQVMPVMEHLTDRIGARLTGSPALREANEWTRSQLEAWGLRNPRLEPWGPFGRGWSFSRASLSLVAPRALPLFALPQAWTPGTEGSVRGRAIRVSLDSESDLETHRGQLAGMILLLDDAQGISPGERPYFQRRSSADLEELEEYPVPAARREPDDGFRRRMMQRARFRPLLHQFLADEGVLAVLRPSPRNDAIVRVGGGGSREVDESAGVTDLVVAAEHYNLLHRLLAAGEEVELEVEVAARFHDDDPMAYNTVAEIPGTDLADQVVMLGAHLDSWHAGTGATDNAAGCTVAMEAVRILQALGVQPRRTIRVALWTGEEQGLLGSRAYVAEHFASRPEPESEEERRMPRFLRRDRGPLTLKPGHSKLAAYFNLDNGSGRIRGIYTQSNAAVVPIFEAWLRPFHDLGADTVTMRNTGGTDHLPFDGVGLPGFQFIQDPLDYSSRTHHTNLDVLDRVQRDDLVQASIVMASFVYHAAMRDELLPRKPLPNEQGDEDED